MPRPPAIVPVARSAYNQRGNENVELVKDQVPQVKTTSTTDKAVEAKENLPDFDKIK